VSQTNLGNETARKLRRRPAKVVSRDDILALKRNCSSDPPDMRCERVPLAPHSAEFKDVEKQFRKSLKLTTVITSIERVQSSSMSKKYGSFLRKNGKMSAVNTGRSKRKFLTERRLFHGTNPKNLKATSKVNFDWRLSCVYICVFTLKDHNRVRRRKVLRFDPHLQLPSSRQERTYY